MNSWGWGPNPIGLVALKKEEDIEFMLLPPLPSRGGKNMLVCSKKVAAGKARERPPPQQNPEALVPSSQTSSLQHDEKMNVIRTPQTMVFCDGSPG